MVRDESPQALASVGQLPPDLSKWSGLSAYSFERGVHEHAREYAKFSCGIAVSLEHSNGTQYEDQTVNHTSENDNIRPDQSSL